jgi:high frequency lysogenization protein
MMRDRAIALAGLMQALRLVQQMANQGQAESRPLQACVDSLFRFDAEDVLAVYGDQQALEPGAQLLLAQLDGRRDPAITRMAVSLLQLERRFSANRDAMEAVHRSLQSLETERRTQGALHPALLAKLGSLYAERVSPLGARVLVQGNPVYLGQPSVVGEVRACLLAGLRAAVLWRQVGGGYLDFVLRRRALLDAVRELAR